jgi:twitching motility two-component system response regulator PilG
MNPASRTRRFSYPEPVPLEPPPPDLPSHSIVIIDDSPTVRKVAEACLRRCGYAVTCFEDGLAALAAFTRQELAPPDLLLLDIELPKMSGYQIAQVLRSKEQFRGTVIVMLTMHDGLLDRLRSRMVGAIGYITKPFHSAFLIEAVRGYLEPVTH